MSSLGTFWLVSFVILCFVQYTVCTGTWLQTFQITPRLLSPSSLFCCKRKAAGFAETYVRTYLTARRHNFQDHSTNCWFNILTLFIPCNKNVCFIYKTNICIHPIHNNIIYALPRCFIDYITIIWQYNTPRCLTLVQMWYSDKSKVHLHHSVTGSEIYVMSDAVKPSKLVCAWLKICLFGILL